LRPFFMMIACAVLKNSEVFDARRRQEINKNFMRQRIEESQESMLDIVL
jgi:hypothetical protein